MTVAIDLHDFAVTVKSHEQDVRRAAAEADRIIGSGIDPRLDDHVPMAAVHANRSLRKQLLNIVTKETGDLLASSIRAASHDGVAVLDAFTKTTPSGECQAAPLAIAAAADAAAAVSHPLAHRFGEADASCWLHALATNNVTVISTTDADCIPWALLSSLSTAHPSPLMWRWYVLWAPAGGTKAIIDVSRIISHAMEVLPSSWSVPERVGSFAAMLIGAGNDFKERLGPVAPGAALDGYITHAAHIGPLVTVGTSGTVLFNHKAAWRYLVLLYRTGYRLGKTKHDEVRASVPDAPSAEAYEKCTAAAPAAPSYLAAQAVLSRWAACVGYASVHARGARSFELSEWTRVPEGAPEGWLPGWVKHTNGSVSIVWGGSHLDDGGVRPLLGPSPDGRTIAVSPARRNKRTKK